jgi:hypothetical protein
MLVSERFSALVRFTDDPNGCWEWQGVRVRTQQGHGMAWCPVRKKMQWAHRMSFEWAHGRAIQEGLQIRHTCDNPRCVNPAHLLEGTAKDNAADRKEHGREATRARGNHWVVRSPEKILRGEQTGTSKLNATQVLEIRSRHEQGETYAAIAPHYGVTADNISYICRRKSWRHL